MQLFHRGANRRAGASFLAAEAGIEEKRQLVNTAAYIQSWIRALKDDPRAVVIAAAQAQKATDCILGSGESVESGSSDLA